jgi:uncharacterized protein YyaL (SSP411 family)
MQMPKKYANHLINETSPYLLQHAHNPVDWYPWGPEAFEKAKAEDKPVLVSIGYSACHWCHVMEHESFESDEIAAIMNEHFINIKVDMEERPDVDQIYMNFVQLTTGRGGWPMNVFLTPEKLPFFGGTYFPPTPRHGMVSWPQILLSIAEAWRERRDELMGSAFEILGELRRMSAAAPAMGGVDESLSDAAYAALERSFDARNGGWGGAPKFPAAMSMEFLLRYWKRMGNENALAMVRHTAEKMARGGIYDQLGGGFHRYSVDAVWLVPHFEKMLYDNAQLIRIYLHLYQIARSGQDQRGDAEFFKRVAVETLEYVRREMTGPDGGFYSTQDADSEGEEGKFFVWTPDEVVAILGEADARVFCLYYDVSEEGNFEGNNILNVKNVPAEVAEALGMSVSEVASAAERGRDVLFAAREKRVKPARDEKVLTAWNGLMLAAFAEASAVLGNEEYLETAKRNAEFLLANLTVRAKDVGGSPVLRSVLRTWKDGKAKLNGYIEDYANLADGLIELYQASGEERYLEEARRLADTMITEFWDEDNGGFYFTSNDHEELIVRNKDLYDNATPSGNSAGADVLLKLAKFYGDERYERFGTAILRLAASQIRQHPQGFGRALSAAEFLLADVKEVAIVGESGSDLECEVWADYRPFQVVALSQGADSDLPLLDGRSKTDGRPTAYVCKGFVCSRPVTEVADLRDSL